MSSMRQSPEYPIVQARLVILMGALLLSLNFVPSTTGTADVAPLVAEQMEAEQRAQARHQEYLAQREAELWQMLVEKIAEETHIDDPELAERVTRALENASAEFDVDPWLMASLIRVESAGDPNIVSRVGAIGLTQIMPATGREIAGDLEIADYSTKMLYHPETNVRMGTYYLSKLLKRFDGNLHAALAAYNWGPHHIAQRIQRREALPVQYPGKILRRIPEQPKWVVAAAKG